MTKFTLIFSIHTVRFQPRHGQPKFDADSDGIPQTLSERVCH